MTKFSLPLILFSLVLSSAYAAEYECNFDKDGREGKVSVKSSGAKAQLVLSYDGNKSEYKDCNYTTDELAQMVECNDLDNDIMVIKSIDSIDDTISIMSTSHDLYTDGNC